MEERKRLLHGDDLRNNEVYQGCFLSLETTRKTLQDTSQDDDPQILGPWFLTGPSHSEASPANPVENTLLDTVTLSSGTLAQSPVARQPFIGKLMSVAPLAGSLWMLSTKAGESNTNRASLAWSGSQLGPRQQALVQDGTSFLRRGAGKVHTARLLLHTSSKPVDPRPHTHSFLHGPLLPDERKPQSLGLASGDCMRHQARIPIGSLILGDSDPTRPCLSWLVPRLRLSHCGQEKVWAQKDLQELGSHLGSHHPPTSLGS